MQVNVFVFVIRYNFSVYLNYPFVMYFLRQKPDLFCFGHLYATQNALPGVRTN